MITDENENVMECQQQENEPENQNNIYQETLLGPNEAVEIAPGNLSFFFQHCLYCHLFKGEGQKPLSMLRDQYSEERSFVGIYAGHPRKEQPPGVNLSYSEIIRSEIMRTDRRAAEHSHLLYANKKCVLIQAQNNINVSMKKSAQSQNLTAGTVLNEGFIDSVVGEDKAFRFLTNVTGTPPYWEQQKKNVLAMVRQFGPFTLFITLTAAETHWKDLLKILKKAVDNVDNADVSDLEFEEKARLIREDPVTCARYFDHRIKALFETWTGTAEGPFGENDVFQRYYRIEFQQRGSPHVHMTVWLKDAPQFNPDRPDTWHQIEDFIDKIVTTSSDIECVKDYIKYQYHKCTRTCRKTSKGKTRCRFGAPFLPMDKTRILKPLPADAMTENEKKEYRDLIKKTNEILSGDLDAIGTFENFLEKLNCDKDKYIKAVQSQLTSHKVYLKRAPKDARVNSYSPKILMLMQANIDVQYVLDPYACIGYIVDYINKASRGVSKLILDAVESFETADLTKKEKMYKVLNAFYNGQEISSQEAAWCRVGLSMSSCSVAVEFINTGPIKVSIRYFRVL